MKQIIKTPCGTFESVGDWKSLYQSLPEHKFGWSPCEFELIHIRNAISDGNACIIDLTK